MQRQLAEDASRRAEEKQAAASRPARRADRRPRPAGRLRRPGARPASSTRSPRPPPSRSSTKTSPPRSAPTRPGPPSWLAGPPRPPHGPRPVAVGRWWRRRWRWRSLNPSLGSAACPGGGSITVASSLVGSLQSMMNAAAVVGHQPLRRWLPLLGRPDRDPAQQLRLQLLRHLREARLAVQPAHGPARAVDARAGPGRRLHLQRRRRDRLPEQPLLPVAGRQRQRLRVLQPPQRALALVLERQLSYCRLVRG